MNFFCLALQTKYVLEVHRDVVISLSIFGLIVIKVHFLVSKENLRMFTVSSLNKVVKPDGYLTRASATRRFTMKLTVIPQ